jgi:small subunit ribosomal protein S19
MAAAKGVSRAAPSARKIFGAILPEASGRGIKRSGRQSLFYGADRRSDSALTMSRSLRKGPYVDPKLLRKISKLKPGEKTVINTWSRDSEISPEMIGFTFGVHNGKTFIPVTVREEMIGHRLGEFAPTRKFVKHGGKMQRELEAAQRTAELAKAKAASASRSGKKK